MRMLKLLISKKISSTLFLVLGSIAFGLSSANAQANPPEITLKPVIGFTTISQAVNTLLTVAGFFGALACLGYLVFGAFKYLTARDEPSKLEEARKTMINAVVGLFLLGLIAVIFQIVVSIIPGLGSWFGADAGGMDQYSQLECQRAGNTWTNGVCH